MSDHPAIVDTDTLREAFGLKRMGDVERYLRARHIVYFIGRKGPWTTIDALNAALGLDSRTGTKKQTVEIL